MEMDSLVDTVTTTLHALSQVLFTRREVAEVAEVVGSL